MIGKQSRAMVGERAEHRCEYCRLPQSFAPLVRFHIEHIVAKCHGGQDHESNLCLACPHCNLLKGPNLSAIDPVTGAISIIFNPRMDAWNQHFRLRGHEVFGLTSRGRATVNLLRMNSADLLSVRAELIALGEY